MTPNDIDILIHYYCSPREHDRFDAPAVIESIETFVLNKIMEKDSSRDSGYRLTGRGDALVRVLCDTPLPRMAWIDGGDNVINHLSGDAVGV